MKVLITVLLSLFLAISSHAAADPELHLLTVDSLQKLRAVNNDLSKASPMKKSKNEDGDDKGSVEHMARKLDAHPQAKTILAKHGMTSMEYALATYALMAAAMHIGFEPHMDKQKAASLYASYTKERKANIDLLRKHPEFMKK